MSLLEEIKSAEVPKHVAIIMDGNRRWAKQKNLPQTSGHKKGLETAREIALAAKKAGIKYLTLYTFSTENWKRTEEEVKFLMDLIREHFKTEFEFYTKNNIKVEHIGYREGLPKDIQEEILQTKENSKKNDGLTLVLAINYGGKDEIIRAINKCKKENKEISEENFAKNFDIPDLPDVDFLIRTGGEKRISNFLLWHSAYAELEFIDKLWPDYTENDFYKSVQDFQNRNRRFGGV